MKRSTKRQTVFPLLTALLFGSSFAVQSLSTGLLRCFTFNWTRSLLAAAVLFGLVKVMARIEGEEKQDRDVRRGERRSLLRGGIVVGTLLMAASNLQYYALGWTSASKAGFITSLYIVIVPCLGFFLHRRVPPSVWAGVFTAVAGLYFLCFDQSGPTALNRGDGYIFVTATLYAIHILAVDHYTNVEGVDGLKLSCLQFAVASAESFLCAMLFEEFSLEQIRLCLPYILYVGIVSGGIGYTLQILAQKGGDPTVVSLLLSFEAFFSAVCGALILRERLNAREYIGCALMLCAAILAQIPEKARPGKAQEQSEALSK